MHNQDSILLCHEWKALHQLGLRDNSAVTSPAVETRALLNDEICLNVLSQIRSDMGAPDLKIAASLVIKRMAFLTLAPLLSGMSCYNKGLDVAIDNCLFEYRMDNRRWQNQMPLKNVQVSVPATQRDVWRDTLLSRAFNGNLSLLVTQFHKLTRVPQAVLWENIAVRIFSIYERRILPALARQEQMAIAQADLSYLIDKTTTEIYHTATNPIARYYGKSSCTAIPPATIRVRRTCCYYYKASEPVEYCSTCPLLHKPKPSRQ